MNGIHVVRTGTANLASVLAALARLGARAVVTDDPREVARADRLLLPGVGSFGTACDRLDRGGWREAIVAHVEAGRPFLAVCLGMQLLARGSDEAPGRRGLGILDVTVRRLAGAPRWPQLGWNRVTWRGGARADGHAYFANGYAITEAPSGWTVATTHHGSPFVSAIARGPQLACQFHPELSGDYGAVLIADWWSRC